MPAAPILDDAQYVWKYQPPVPGMQGAAFPRP